jgi:F-type H+-transporting ATPase subunit b
MTFNFWTFLFEMLNFLVLAYVLYRLLYRPLHQAIDRRREATARAQTEAETVRQEALAMQQQLQGQLAEVDKQRQEAIRQAQIEGETRRRELLAQAERAVQRRQEEVRQELEKERQEALAALRGDVVEQAVDLSRRLLRGAANRGLNEQFAERLAESLEGLPEVEREQVRQYWRLEDGAVLETAVDMNGEVKRRLSEAVTAVVGEPVELAVVTKPDLVGGVRLRLGGHVWDASLAGQLDQARRLDLLGGKLCPSASSN